nr:MAG TPA: hypothetical protein [Caudoviricetes sp.]
MLKICGWNRRQQTVLRLLKLIFLMASAPPISRDTVLFPKALLGCGRTERYFPVKWSPRGSHGRSWTPCRGNMSGSNTTI